MDSEEQTVTCDRLVCTSVKISFMNISTVVQEILSKMNISTNLVDIDLSDNYVDDFCAEILSEDIFSIPEYGDRIRQLNLSNNRKTLEGLQTLASALCHKTAFKYLVVAINCVSVTDYSSIERFLAKKIPWTDPQFRDNNRDQYVQSCVRKIIWSTEPGIWSIEAYGFSKEIVEAHREFYNSN